MEDTQQQLAMVHWRSPVTMISALVISAGLAGGHHAFYRSLEGKRVSGDPYNFAGWEVSQQQFTVAVGTAFAFLFKASLLLAVSIAYMQLFFRAINSADFSIGRLDNWFSGLTDLWSLCCITTYYKHALLAYVAITAWLLPIAAVLPPASISVSLGQILPSPTTLMAVPQPAFDSLAFQELTADQVYNANVTMLGSVGAKEEVTRVARAVSAAGSILPIPPPGLNASWQVRSEAPRVLCDDVDDSTRRLIRNNLLQTLKRDTADTQGLNGSLVTLLPASATTPLLATKSDGTITTLETAGAPTPYLLDVGNASNSVSMFTYLAWSATHFDMASPQNLPFSGNRSNTVFSGQEWSQYAGDSMVYLYVAVFPRAASTDVPDVWRGKLYFDGPVMDWYFEDATMLHCQLGAANYTLDYKYHGLVQEQEINIVSIDKTPLPTHVINGVQLNLIADGGVNITGYGPQDPWLDGRLSMRQWSFLTLWDVVGSLITGASNPDGNVIGVATLGDNVWGTQVFSTSLVNTRELSAISQEQLTASNITYSTKGEHFDYVQSLMSPGLGQAPQKSLKDAIEELFFNISTSMASSESLRYNNTSPMAPPHVNVTFDEYGNIFVYSPAKLWLAYGIGLMFGAIDVCIGLWAVYSTGASSTRDFSTILRIAKNADINTETHEAVLPGRDPLPKNIRDAKLSIRASSAIELGKLTHARYRQIEQSEDDLAGSDTRLAR